MVGRPKFKPTRHQRREVEILAGAHVSQEDIARRLKIDAKTLREHFREELDNGAVKRRTDIIIAQYERAVKTSSTDATKYLGYGNIEPNPNGPARPAKPEEPGKKELAHIGAQTAEKGTSWDDLVNPVVVN
jgi:DNA-binding CsgD family transcriptional regulator